MINSALVRWYAGTSVRRYVVLLVLFLCLTPLMAQDDEAKMESLSKPTPELLSRGKDLYAVQCSICHGMEGKGDGVAGVAMTPPPRNFASGEWKFGGGPRAVFNTITKGSPGTSMVGYSGLSLEDRWGLAHYVRSLSPNPPEDLSSVEEKEENAGEKEENKPKARTSVEFAIEQLIRESE